MEDIPSTIEHGLGGHRTLSVYNKSWLMVYGTGSVVQHAHTCTHAHTHTRTHSDTHTPSRARRAGQELVNTRRHALSQPNMFHPKKIKHKAKRTAFTGNFAPLERCC